MTRRHLISLSVAALLLPTVAFAQQAPPTCEDNLAISNQLLQDFNQQRGQLQVENASLKVQLGRMQKAEQEAKAKGETEKKGKK